MGRGARSESGVVPARRGSGAVVHPADVLAHQKMDLEETLAIRDATARGVIGWEIDGDSCCELSGDAATQVPLTGLPPAVALEAWFEERLDFDHLMRALAPATTLLPDSVYAAFPELLELA